MTFMMHQRKKKQVKTPSAEQPSVALLSLEPPGSRGQQLDTCFSHSAQSSHHRSSLGAKYQEASSPPPTLRHQKHLLGHVLGHLGDSVPTVCAAVLLERLAWHSTRPGRAAMGTGRGAAGRPL